MVKEFPGTVNSDQPLAANESQVMTISELGFRISDFVGCVKLFSADTSPPLRKGGQGGSGENVYSHATAGLTRCDEPFGEGVSLRRGRQNKVTRPPRPPLAKGGRNRSSIFHLPSSIFHPRSSTRHPGAGTDSKRIGPPGSPGLTARGAFTLVEMLVAVGLVVLMMTLFATIFQIATGAMATQKGLAENDQRVRLVLTRLRNDLNGNTQDKNDPNRPYRTFRNLVPYGPDEIPPVAGFVDRLGYFYISENDPNDDTDDVLALTVSMPLTSPERFTGRAAVVFPNGTGSYGPGNPTPGPNPYPPPAPATANVAATPGNGQNYWPNQPEFDDIQGTPNLAGSSAYAEVCYFLRRGTLYRRVMLIRQPNLSPPSQAQDGNPTDSSLFALTLNTASDYGANGTRNFWTDFDYAAFFNGRIATPALRFHGAGSTCVFSSLAPTGTVPFNPFVLGNPAYRFGFDDSVNAAQSPTATSPDNSGVNVRDRADNAMTAGEQSGSKQDIKLTARIRRAIVKDKSLSMMAHNVKIVSVNGAVTLRGPVKSDQEKARIASKAQAIAGADRVDNQLEVAGQ